VYSLEDAASGYPINLLRNKAYESASTRYVLQIDADFVPCPDIESRLLHHLTRLSRLTSIDMQRTVFVVPAFEFIEVPNDDESFAESKEELLQLIFRDDPLIQPFRKSADCLWLTRRRRAATSRRRSICLLMPVSCPVPGLLESPESHKLTNYWKWYSSERPYPVISYSDKYEPYLLLTKHESVPRFDARFSGYGMNKITFVAELFAARYRFHVLPDVWITHLPHRLSTYSQHFLQNIRQRIKNRALRFDFICRLIAKYHLY
jgi:glycosyltransferase-like protein LARGE